jgi:hypothetical protein
MLTRKKKPDVVFNWHPNFRDVATLPDIKQVRTGFLINFVAIVLALVALAWTLYTEVEIYKVNHDIAVLNSGIDQNASANSKALAATKNFVTASKPMQYAARFFAQKMPPLELLTSLVDARPDNIVFDSIALDSVVLDLGGGKKASTQRITIDGILTSESELGLQEYVDKVSASPALKGRMGDPVKDRKIESHRDAIAGAFKFTITLTLKPTS